MHPRCSLSAAALMKPEPCQSRHAEGPPHIARVRTSTKLSGPKAVVLSLQPHPHHHRRLTEPEASSSASLLVSIPTPEAHRAARDILLDLWTTFRRKGQLLAAAAYRIECWQPGPRVRAPDLNQGDSARRATKRSKSAELAIGVVEGPKDQSSYKQTWPTIRSTCHRWW